MTIRKQPNGNGCANATQWANGKRVRKQFATKGEAIAFENFTNGRSETKTVVGVKRKIGDAYQN